jgi:hypothetical protein
VNADTRGSLADFFRSVDLPADGSDTDDGTVFEVEVLAENWTAVDIFRHCLPSYATGMAVIY